MTSHELANELLALPCKKVRVYDPDLEAFAEVSGFVHDDAKGVIDIYVDEDFMDAVEADFT